MVPSLILLIRIGIRRRTFWQEEKQLSRSELRLYLEAKDSCVPFLITYMAILLKTS